MMVSTELPEVVTLAGAKLPDAPVGSPDTERDTVPVNPFSAAMVLVSVIDPPAVTCNEFTLSERVKLGCATAATSKVTVAVCEALPEIPVIVNV